MAYWIVSGTREQDIRATVNKAFRAAETALKSIAELLSPLDQTPLGLRIGLNYGEPYSGNFGSESRHAFTLIGHDVNLAARLEQASAGVNEEPLGSIRVGENFYQYLDAANRLRLSAPIAFKVKKTEATLFTNLPATAD
jgi:class 3 adenylate cyclase